MPLSRYVPAPASTLRAASPSLGLRDEVEATRRTTAVHQDGRQRSISIVLRRGDELCASLVEVVERFELDGAALVAAVGSYSDVAYSLPALRQDGSVTYADVRRASGLFSIVSLSGHFGRDDDGAVHHHLHSAFAREDGVVFGGHLFSGTVLATAEITLLPGSPWRATLGPQVEDEQAWMLIRPEE